MINSGRPGRNRVWELLASVLIVVGVTLTILAVVILAVSSDLGLIVVLVGPVYLAGAVGWSIWTGQIRAALGDRDRRFRDSWVAMTAVFCLVLVGSCGGPALAARVGRTVSYDIACILLIVSFTISVYLIRAGRDRVRDVATRPHPGEDAFWAAVAGWSRSAGADLALLETTGTADRRWLLISASGDVTTPRSETAPGALLTLFAMPPGRLSPDIASRLAPAAEYYGLLEPAPGGPVHFELVPPSRLTDFLTAAANAHRAGLYLPDDPTALTAATVAA